MADGPSPAGRAARFGERALATFPHAMETATRFSDVDPLRHVNNVAMGHLFAEGRLQFHRDLFDRVARPPGMLLMVVQINMTFVGETHYPGAVAIGLGVTKVGRSSIAYHQRLFQDGRCNSLCETTLVTLVERTPFAFDGAMRDALEAYRLPPG